VKRQTFGGEAAEAGCRVWCSWWRACGTPATGASDSALTRRPRPAPPKNLCGHTPASGTSTGTRLCLTAPVRARDGGGVRTGSTPCLAGGRRHAANGHASRGTRGGGPHSCWLRPARATLGPRPCRPGGPGELSPGRSRTTESSEGSPAHRPSRHALSIPRHGGLRGAVVGPMWLSTNHTSPPAVRRSTILPPFKTQILPVGAFRSRDPQCHLTDIVGRVSVVDLHSNGSANLYPPIIVRIFP